MSESSPDEVDFASSVNAVPYPTSSTTLQQHSRIRILWLTLSYCLRVSGEHVHVTSDGSSLSVSMRTVNSSLSRGSCTHQRTLSQQLNAKSTGSSNELSTGFELCFKEGLRRHAVLPVEDLRGAFPPSSSCYEPGAALRFFVDDDMSASQWENMELHRRTHAVVVVFNPAIGLSVSPEHALRAVNIVFNSLFKGRVCRCYVVDPPDSLQPTLQSSAFFSTVTSSSGQTIDAAAQMAMNELARAVIHGMCESFVRITQANSQFASGSGGSSSPAVPPVDLTSLRTPLDKNPVTLKPVQLMSRLAKKRGDMMMLLGSPALALRAYAETRFASNADPLWCSATMEAIAAARYQLLSPLILNLSFINDTLLFVQNESTDWGRGGEVLRRVQQVESTLTKAVDSFRESLALFKSNSVSSTMRQRLLKEIEDPLSVVVGTLRGLLQRVKACTEAGSADLDSDPLAHRVGKDLRQCVKEILTLLAAETEIYLRESLRQLRKSAGSSVSTTASSIISGFTNSTNLSVSIPEANGEPGSIAAIVGAPLVHDRYLENRLKMASYYATKRSGNRSAFLAEVQEIRRVLSTGFFDVFVRPVGTFLVFLFVHARCRRRAISLLVETAQGHRSAQRIEDAVQCLAQACFLCGVPLNLPELRHEGPNDTVHCAFLRSYGIPCCDATRQQVVPSTAPMGCVSPGTSTNDLSFYAPTTVTVYGGVSSSCKRTGGAYPNSTPHHSDVLAVDDLGCSGPQQLHVSLLMELLDMLSSAGHSVSAGNSNNNPTGASNIIRVDDDSSSSASTSGVLCRLASLILFRYHAYLNRDDQASLLAVIAADAPQLAPYMSPSTVAIPFLFSWEALPLPPQLAPKTVSVGGALFTFIDTARLKHTVFSLNGKRLNSRVVWTVGDVGTIVMTLRNPLQHVIYIRTLALQCSSRGAKRQNAPHKNTKKRDEAEERGGSGGDRKKNNNKEDEANDDVEGDVADAELISDGPFAPISYVLRDVVLTPLSKQQVQLQVQPQLEGNIVVQGVSMHISGVDSLVPFTGVLAEPISVPVLQRLPLLSCTISASEVEIFSGQSINFWVRVVNCGVVPIDRISLTAHSEACLLEDCEGCMERASTMTSTVFLNKAALEAAKRTPLQPGDVVTIPARVDAPATIARVAAHFVVFRADCSLPYETPTMPPDVPSAVPVFGVIPRRVMETRMRLFHAPSLDVLSIVLTKDRRFADIRIINRSRRHSVELHLSHLRFATLPNALIVAGAEFVVPSIEITSFPEGMLTHHVPWHVRELPHCTGRLLLDFSHILTEALCTEPLDECGIVVDVDIPSVNTLTGESFVARRRWESVSKSTSRRGGNRSWRGASGGSGCHRRRRRTRPQSPTVYSNTYNHHPMSSGSGSSSCSDASDGEYADDSLITYSVDGSSGAMGFSTATEQAYLQDSHATMNAKVGGGIKKSASMTSGSAKRSRMPIVLPAMKPVLLHVRASAPWRRATRLRFQVEMDHHFDVGVLTGSVDSFADVGEHGTRSYSQCFELFAMKTGEHTITFTISDSSEREISHELRVVVVHSREQLGFQT